MCAHACVRRCEYVLVWELGNGKDGKVGGDEGISSQPSALNQLPFPEIVTYEAEGLGQPEMGAGLTRNHSSLGIKNNTPGIKSSRV